MADTFMLNFIVYFVWQIIAISGYDIHLDERDSPGRFIFNASLGSDWTYHLKSKGHSDFLTLDSVTAVLFLSKNVRCQDLRENPVGSSISAVHHYREIHTQYHISIYFHGNNCRPKNKHKHSDIQYIQFPYQDTLLIDITLQPLYGHCIARSKSIVKMRQYLPVTLTAKCDLNYHIDQNELLNIDSDSGEITTHKEFCLKESAQMFYIQMNTTCKTIQNQRMTARVSINSQLEKANSLTQVKRIRRAANSRPQFPHSLYTISAPEEQNPGVVIETITADDPDSGREGDLRYSLVATGDVRSQNMFAIDEVSGQISTTQRLDRESIDLHFFTITAEDTSSQPRTAQASVRIYVEDINDHSPEFESDVYSK